jgi:hypothetical protein
MSFTASKVFARDFGEPWISCMGSVYGKGSHRNNKDQRNHFNFKHEIA